MAKESNPLPKKTYVRAGIEYTWYNGFIASTDKESIGSSIFLE